MGAISTASSTGDTASNKSRPYGGFRYVSGGGICVVQSSVSSALLLVRTVASTSTEASMHSITEESEALVGGGEGIGAIGEVS